MRLYHEESYHRWRVRFAQNVVITREYLIRYILLSVDFDIFPFKSAYWHVTNNHWVCSIASLSLSYFTFMVGNFKSIPPMYVKLISQILIPWQQHGCQPGKPSPHGDGTYYMFLPCFFQVQNLGEIFSRLIILWC